MMILMKFDGKYATINGIAVLNDSSSYKYSSASPPLLYPALKIAQMGGLVSGESKSKSYNLNK